MKKTNDHDLQSVSVSIFTDENDAAKILFELGRENQNLKFENAKLKSEIQKLKMAIEVIKSENQFFVG